MLTIISAISLLVLFATISTVSVLPITYASDHEPIIIHPIQDLEDATICDPCFDPSIVTISEGDVVTFVNNDKSNHTLTAGTAYDGPMYDSTCVQENEGVVDECYILNSGLIKPGDSYTILNLEVGEYPYFDMIHPWMTGMILVVQGTDTEAPAEEVIVEAPAEEVIVEAPAEEVIVEAPAEEVIVDEVEVDDTQSISGSNEKGGGCLIATAAYGSEMAPQVQFLREIRDNTVLQTQSGTSFMTVFNSFYYTFSPTIADYERENPVFKEAVKIGLAPLLTSLTILNYVDIDTEQEMLGYGIGIIMLNIGMYFVAPAVVIIALKKRRK